MKDKMTKEEINKKMEEEHLEEVSGGFNSLHRKVGGYADSNVVHTVLNEDTDAKNSHPVMDGKEKPVATNLKKESMLGTPVLVDTNDVEKKRILGGNTLV
jgi:hypothetical protein